MNIGISSMGMYNQQNWTHKINLLLSNIDKKLDFTVHYAEDVDDLDLLIFDGGSDVNPKLYGQDKYSYTFCNELRDLHEKELFEKFLHKSTLYAGICRGLQFLNVMYRGTLYQDIYSYFGYDHGYIHTVVCKENRNLKNYVPKIFDVNSLHHQAICDIGKNIIVTFVDSNDLVEGIETKDDKVRAVQCHPEMNSFNESYNLLRYLLRL